MKPLLAIGIVVAVALVLMHASWALFGQGQFLAGNPAARNILHPINITATGGTISDSAPLGTQIFTLAITMSDGSPFSGTLTAQDGTGIVCSVSPCTVGTTIVAARNVTATDDGQHTVAITANTGTQPFTKAFTLVVQPSIVGIACAQGPNFTGTIPQPAVAAGYTTCIANLDFTVTASFTNGGNTYQWSNLSSWLSCPGVNAPNAILYLSGDSGSANPQCSDISIATDGGKQVLKMDLPQANPNGSGGDELTGSEDISPGWTIPVGAYFQATLREPNCSAQPSSFHCSNFWLWVHDQGTNTSHVEVDHEEDFTGGAGSFLHEYVPSGASSSPTFSTAQWPPTSTYATVGSLVTHNGSTRLADCNYSNGVAVSSSCQSLAVSSAQVAARNYVTMSGSAHANTTGLNADQIVYWQNVLIFACASWATTNCSGTVITTAP